ncbi:MAG: hypothetical protein U9Q29_07710 [Campylobacterota bacterium]|nr:hypothetical protein [Campylobacterota bacterium]
MIKIILLLLPFLLNAQTLQVQESITPTIIKSQHDKEYKLITDGIWIVSKEKATTKIANEFFNNFHMPKNINLIIDATQVPFGLFDFFVLPTLQKYRHPILLSFDENYNSTLPYKENHLAILYIQNKKIIKIEYVKTLSKKDLLKVLKPLSQ